MESEIQSNIPQAQPLTQVTTPVSALTNWSKILLFTVLGLIIVAGVVLVGIQISKSQETISTATTTIPTSIMVNPTPSNSSITNPTSKSPCQIVKNDFSDSNSNHNFDLIIKESPQGGKCNLINNSVGYTLDFNNDWKVFPSGAISSPAIGFIKDNGVDKSKEQLYTLIVTRDIVGDKSTMEIENAEKIIIAGEGGSAPLTNKFQDIIRKKVIIIGNYQVLDLTTTYNTVEKSGKNADYTKTYILLDKSKGFIYEFILNSYQPTFDNPESLGMIKDTKEIISFFKVF